MTLTAPVNRIIPFSTVDGPGSRTSVFFQACNIACAYCHNPETQNMCCNCGACVPGCPEGALSMADGRVVWDPDKCVECDACIITCPHLASPRVKTMTPRQVMDEVCKNIPFIRGITTSGGECSLRADFLTELFTMAQKEGLTCLMDSNGIVDLAAYPALMEVCDGVMLDVKAWDSQVHRALTGADNVNVKKNLGFLSEHGKLEEIRIVCIDELVDTRAAIDGIARTIGPRRTQTRLKLITFRKSGVRGGLSVTPSPSPETMQAHADYARAAGFNNIVLT